MYTFERVLRASYTYTLLILRHTRNDKNGFGMRHNAKGQQIITEHILIFYTFLLLFFSFKGQMNKRAYSGRNGMGKTVTSEK